jgi:hypothetical protein
MAPDLRNPRRHPHQGTDFSTLYGGRSEKSQAPSTSRYRFLDSVWHQLREFPGTSNIKEQISGLYGTKSEKSSATSTSRYRFLDSI